MYREKLALFSESILTLNPPVHERDILETEKIIGIILPQEYKAFLLECNGFSLLGNVVYGIGNAGNIPSLEIQNDYEHKISSFSLMPKYVIPFSPDGGGNHYCFDMSLSTEDSCPIVFWQIGYVYSEADKPEVVNNSFSDWFNEVVIEWTLENYDYEGNEK